MTTQIGAGLALHQAGKLIQSTAGGASIMLVPLA